MKLAIYGTGYVGLIAGVCFANLGHEVLCYDIDSKKINDLKAGKPVLYEKDFEDLLKKALERKALSFTTNIHEVVAFANIHLMCVGTPSEEDGSANLSYLFAAVENLAMHVKKPFLIINKSTVPIGTALQLKEIVKHILNLKGNVVDFEIASCPEFLAQGNAIFDFMHPQRIVVGTENNHAFETIKELYDPVIHCEGYPEVPVLHMSSISAEMTKYASNLFLASKISFMNEMSRIAELVGADISDVSKGMILDKRIGAGMSNPGCGFGGSCFPKDLKALIHQSESYGYPPLLLHSILEINKSQKKYFINKIFTFFDFDMKNKVIAVWGLSFKPNTDDLRESISCDLIEALLKAGAIVQAYDPVSNRNAEKKFSEYSNFHAYKSKEEALKNVDALAVMTEWPEFSSLNVDSIKKAMRFPVVFDGRNIYEQKVLNDAGILYFAIGKGNPQKSYKSLAA